MSDWRVETGDCREVMAAMADNSVDAIVTDPPYGLGKEPDALAMLADWLQHGHHDVKGRGFMGKEWDAFVPQPSVWRECIRVLKPGGHLIAFGGTRTVDLVALGLRITGFEIRDQVLWLYASGFPKSLNVSKAIDAHLGAEREKVRTPITKHSTAGKGLSNEIDERPWLTAARECGYHEHDGSTPATPEAQQFDGWGTALKPAHEPAVLARKPLIGTVAANVLAWGTGGINIAGCRIETADDLNGGGYSGGTPKTMFDGLGRLEPSDFQQPAGRWPANLIHDGSDEVLALFPDRQGKNKTGKKVNTSTCLGQKISKDVYGGGRKEAETFVYEGSGSAARYFYTVKASRDDRDDGLDGFDLADAGERAGGRAEGSAGLDNPRAGTRTKGRNTHPTVKPTDLMRYLCRLVTPPGGLILDPFCGSGSTGRAALLEGFQFVGIELLEDHARIARARIKCIADRGVQLQLTADAV